MYLIIWCELESRKSNARVSLDYLIEFQGFYIKYIFVCWFFLFVSQSTMYVRKVLYYKPLTQTNFFNCKYIFPLLIL